MFPLSNCHVCTRFLYYLVMHTGLYDFGACQQNAHCHLGGRQNNHCYSLLSPAILYVRLFPTITAFGIFVSLYSKINFRFQNYYYVAKLVYGVMQKKIGSDISRAAYADNTRIAHPIIRSTEQKAYYRDAFLRHTG
jgi:hypothetical protein